MTATAHTSPLINMEEWQRATEEGIEQKGGGEGVVCAACFAGPEMRVKLSELLASKP